MCDGSGCVFGRLLVDAAPPAAPEVYQCGDDHDRQANGDQDQDKPSHRSSELGKFPHGRNATCLEAGGVLALRVRATRIGVTSNWRHGLLLDKPTAKQGLSSQRSRLNRWDPRQQPSRRRQLQQA